MNGPGGDLPLLLWDGSAVRVICGQGPAPLAASVDAYRSLGLRARAGDRAAGRLRAGRVRRLDDAAARLRDVGAGRRVPRTRSATRATAFPATPGIASAIARIDPSWDASRRRCGCRRQGARLRNPLLADTYARIVRAARRAVARGAHRRRARRLVPRFVAGRRRGRAGEAFLEPAGVIWRRPGGSRATVEAPASLGVPRLDGVQDRARGARDRCSCSSSRCSTASTWASSSASTTSTRWSRARSSRSRTARRGTATRRRSAGHAALARVRRVRAAR